MTALAALAWAELNWSLATLGPSGGGIGIGTSGYASVLYGRAIALGVMSAAFAAIGVLRRRYTDFVISYREAPRTPPLP
jgi:glycine cleavage system aminomethyltransferase T